MREAQPNSTRGKCAKTFDGTESQSGTRLKCTQGIRKRGEGVAGHILEDTLPARAIDIYQVPGIYYRNEKSTAVRI